MASPESVHHFYPPYKRFSVEFGIQNHHNIPPVSAETAEPRADGPVKGEARARGAHGRTGLLYGLAAYISWGFIPLYFHALSSVPPVVVLCHRIIWSVLFLVAAVFARREWGAVWPVLKQRRSLLLLTAGAALIALN